MQTRRFGRTNHHSTVAIFGAAALWTVRRQFFLGCKTMERDAAGAAAELRRSLDRLRVDAFDLYQIHAVETLADLDAATRPGGALDAMVQAREEGLTRWIGITGHGVDSPAVFREALRRFESSR